jgi:hypothetical protein
MISSPSNPRRCIVKNIILVSLFCISFLTTLNCTGPNGNIPDPIPTPNIPKWCTDLPKNDEYIYACGFGLSSSKRLSGVEAETDARGKLSTGIESKVKAVFKSFEEELRNTQEVEYLKHISATIEVVSSQTLPACTRVNDEIIKEGNDYYTYVLMQLPVFTVEKALLKAIKEDEWLYERMRIRDEYKELEEKVAQIESLTE